MNYARTIDRGERRISSRRKRPASYYVGQILATVFCVLWAFPVYWMVLTAFKPRVDAQSVPPTFVPLRPTLDNFVSALSQPMFISSLVNSVVVVLAAVGVAIVLGVLAAAALARFRFRGRRAILGAIIVVQMIPGTALMIPLFFVFNAAGLLGHYAGLILAYVATALPFAVWVMRGFFLSIPKELEEAAQTDGATAWQVLTRILFPLVVPGVIATSIFTFITAWNDYLFAYTFMNDQSSYTLPIWLASFTSPALGTDVGGQMAASVVFALPVVVFFLVIQRHLVTGMSSGAVKG